ncbi:MAG TPA: Ppx/GppA phosphatase family protein [Acetobacteraceae bacterium]|nr:Ppx/GppA phosphatase family protein [Acetobacteraceae bacterium]
MPEYAAISSPDLPAPEHGRIAPPSFAAVDLGTNNCRLLVGTPTRDGFRVLDSLSRIVRLGEGLQASGRLSDEAMERAMVALRCCTQRLAKRELRGLRAVATEACRQAENGGAFLARIRQETGLPVAAISTREEVELALESCAPLLAGDGRRALLFDIGGGSTELAWVRLGEGTPRVIGHVSLPVGIITLSERYGGAAQSEVGFAAMVDDVTARLRGFEAVHCIRHEIRQGGVRLLGTSGTVTTLAGVTLDLPRYSRAAVDGVVLLHREASAALEKLRALGSAGRAAHPCVGPERADSVLPGCAIFAAIQHLWPAPQVVVADRGLREGMLLRMMRAERSPARRRPACGEAAMHGGGDSWRLPAMAHRPADA